MFLKGVKKIIIIHCVSLLCHLQSARANDDLSAARDADLELIITGCVQPTVKHKRILTPVLSVQGDQVSVLKKNTQQQFPGICLAR